MMGLPQTGGPIKCGLLSDKAEISQQWEVAAKFRTRDRHRKHDKYNLDLQSTVILITAVELRIRTHGLSLLLAS